MDKIKEILSKTASCRAAVIGDFTLDFYITTDQSAGEISIETGLPTLPVKEYRTSPGGAGNAAVNIAALGIKKTAAFGVVGSDMFGKELTDILKKKNIDVSGMIIQEEDWNTCVYTKIINNSIEGNRLDFGNFNSLENKTADLLISSLEKAIPETDVIVINQQLSSGLHNSYFRNQLIELLEKYPDVLCITDSRDFPEIYNGTSRKINREEAVKVLERENKHIKKSIDKDRKTAEELYKLWKKPVYLTRGERGIIVCDNKSCQEIQGIQLQGELDTVGAGDTALAAIAAVTGSGFSPYEAAVIGNLASAVTVQKLHTTGTASPEEIFEQHEKSVYVYNPELALNDNEASYWKNSEIEIINKTSQHQNLKFALFDHDGTISTLRQGWEDVMIPMMTESIIGDADIDSVLYKKIWMRVYEFVDITTGLMTLIQMEGLVSIIREFNLVPENKILDKFEYKEIFDDRLMSLVNSRTDKLNKGELDINDVTMKGAVDFLNTLREKGLTLYLASGTDEEDVKKEAESLGYHDLFNGGIFGASKDITNEPKKAVINNIIRTVGKNNAAQIITFGDGPVEIIETRNAGGMAVGIASDEVRRYGINRSKRTRLIKAGADIIIRDYSQSNILFDLIDKK